MVQAPASSLPTIYQRAFVRQVPGAAVVEEVALFLVLLTVYALFRGSAITRPVHVVVIAVAGAVGFTTVENLLAVWAAPQIATAASNGFSARLFALVAYLASAVH